MNKKEFLKELRKRMRDLPSGDVEKYIEYYEEMIDDSMEDGMTEAEAVAAIGPLDEIAEMITQEGNRTPFKHKLYAWQIILIILGFPVWGSLLISLVAIVISVFASVFAVIVSLYAVDLVLAFCGCFSVVRFILLIVQGSSFMYVLLALGVGLLGIGLSILLFFGCYALLKLSIYFIKFLFRACKKPFQRKRGVK